MKNAIFTIGCVFAVILATAQVPSLKWAKSLGGASTKENVFSNSVAIDASGNVYTAGTLKNGIADLDPGSGTFNLTFSVDGGMFISKLDASGNFVWARQFANGASTSSYPVAIAVDPSGNVYATGSFLGTGDFDPGTGVINLTSAGEEDIFILKLDADGNFAWAKRIGAANSDAGMSIAVDVLGKVYSTGWYTREVDFDPGSGIHNLAPNGCPTCTHFGAYVLKLDTDGNFVWADQLGAGSGDATGNAIAIDAGNVYTTGKFNGPTADFDPGPGTANIGDATANYKTFISKLDAFGQFVWAKCLIGEVAFTNPNPHSIQVDVSGNVLTAGYFTGTVDFDPGANTFNLSPADGFRDAYISELDASGNFGWAKGMGTTGSDDEVNSLVLDASGNVYTIGQYSGTVDFDPGSGTFDLTSSTSSIDIFMSKLDVAGNFKWAIDIGKTFDPYNYNQQAIGTDAQGNIYATGLYFGTVDFDPGAGIVDLIPAGGGDIFVLKLGPSATGIKEHGTANDMSIYPNPGRAKINILFKQEQKNITVRLTDMTGKEIKTISFTGKQLIIEKGEIKEGLYLVQILDGNRIVESRKIIMQ